MTSKKLLVKLIQQAENAEVLEDLLEEQALTTERRIFLLSDAAWKFKAAHGSRSAWAQEDIAYLKRRCRMFWFLRKYSWLLLQEQ